MNRATKLFIELFQKTIYYEHFQTLMATYTVRGNEETTRVSY